MFDWITSVVTSLGYTGVAALTFLENLFPPLPSEVIIPLAGLVSARGPMRLELVVAMGTLGSLVGASVWYVIGRRMGDARLRKNTATNVLLVALAVLLVKRYVQCWRESGGRPDVGPASV